MSDVFMVRLSAKLKDQLQQIAECRETNMSEVVKQLVLNA
jgi:predicted transcriptional regulator